MELAAERTRIIEELKEQAAFLKDRIEEYEKEDEGRQRLRAVVETMEQVAELLASLEAAPAGAPEEPEEVSRPADENDVDGWLTYVAAHPGDQEALSHLERLETKARIDEDWDTVLAILMGKVAQEESDEARLALLREAQRIYEQEVGDLAKAFDAAQMVHALAPEDESALQELLRLAEATEQWAALVGHFNEVIPTVGDPKAAARLWLLAARTYNERLKRIDYAAAALSAGIEQDPDNPELWDELATLYKANSQWKDLAAVLERRLQVVQDKDQQVFYLLELADLYESRLADPVEAKIRYERLLELDPKNEAALASLEGICRSLDLWSALADVLRRKLELAESEEERIRIRLELADLLAKEMEDPEGALKELEALASSQNPEVFRRLLTLYEALDRPDDFLRTAKKLAELTQDDEERVRLYRRIVAELELSPETSAQAVEYLEKLRDLVPEDPSVYESLERHYTEEQAWEELAATLEAHVEHAASVEEKVSLLKQLAAVQDEQLGKPEIAEQTIRKVLVLDPAEPEALALLSSLLRRQEKWVDLVEVLTQRAELEEDDTALADLHQEIGRITAEKLGDLDAAEERLLKALELDERNVGAATALFQVYKTKGNWLRAAKFGQKAAELTANPLQRASLLFEIAEIYREKVDDLETAVQFYHKALAVDPEHVEAAKRLQDYYYEAEDWEQAEPFLDLVVRQDIQDRKERFLYESRLGFTARELRKLDKAIAHLEKARELDPANLDVLYALADLKYKAEKWQEAANLYQAILVGHKQDLSKKQLVELYHRLGTIRLHMDEKDKALNLFEKALDLDPEYEPSAQAVIHLRSEAHDYDKVVAAKEALLRKAKSKEERHDILVEIADIYKDQLSDEEMALEYYERAVQEDPSDHLTIHKMMELYTSLEQWDRVAEMVLKLEAIEEDPTIKAKYHYAAAVIYRDELADLDLALEHFEKALEADPDNQQAFDAIERILTSEQRWKELARAYRRQLKRIADSADVATKVRLLDKMGHVYLDELQEAETAMAAFEAAANLDPKDKERNELLADLYVQAGPSKADKAIEHLQRLIRANPYHILSYKRLFELYVQTKQKDKVWCLCSALVFLKQADERQRLFYDKYRSKGLVRAKRRLTDKLWRELLAHPSEHKYLSAVMAGIAVPAALLTARPHKAFGLKRKERVDPEKDERPFVKLFGYAADVLDIRLRPELYLRRDQLLPIQLANTRDRNALVPSWVVDEEKLAKKSELEAIFVLARHLAFHRPERFLKRALPSQAELAAALTAALRIMVPEANIRLDNPHVKRFEEHLKMVVPPMVFEQLAPAAKQLVAAGRKAADLPTWFRATELTALRTAFLLSNDFPVVSRAVATEPDGVTGIPAKERITELLVFSVSEEYFALREHLGFAIE